MEEIIKINYESEQPTVSARELHEGLGICTQYTKWFDRMCEYGFSENVDFILVSQKRLTNNPKNPTATIIDHEISIDMAKQICMIQRTDKGKQYRQYFLDLEKAWNTPEQVMARALKIANNEIDKLKADNRVLIADTERMKPKEIFADAVSSSKDSCLIGDLAKIICQNGYKIGRNRLFEWMKTNGYLIKGGSSKNMPTQKAMEMKLFEVKETTITTPDGSTNVKRTTKVTGKGQVYFVNKFAEVEG